MTQFKKATLPAAIGFMALFSSLVIQAAESEESTGPEFYGMLYVSTDLIKSEAKGEPSHWEFNSRNSRVGVKQAIPLNDELTAIYKIETGVEIDDGDKNGKSFYQRDIYLGVKGDYGQIIGGRFNTPMRMAEGKIDPFNHLDGDITAVLGGHVRVKNIVQYTSPEYANTVVNVAFMPGELEDLNGDGKDDNRIANAFSASAVYKEGNLYASFALDKNMPSKVVTEIYELDANNKIKPRRSDRVQLAAKYQLGAAAFGTIIQHAKDSDNSDLKENAFIVNGTYRINDYTLKAQYGLNKGDSTKNERTLAAVGVNYHIAKNSTASVNYTITGEEPKGGSKDEDKALTFAYNIKF